MAHLQDDPDATEAAAACSVKRVVALARRLAIGFALLVTLASQGFLSSYRIAGSSMTPAFLDGDRVVVAGLSSWSLPPRRGETVIAEVRGEVVIKRVAGLPGETIALGHGVVLSDGLPADDPIPASFHDRCDFAPVRLARDEYFLLGDHRCVSVDSREFGPVARDSILGRVIMRVPRREPQAAAAARARD